MRDIKFRYWDPVYHDPVNGQMIYSEVKGLKWFFKRYQEAVDLHNNPTLMQFTGLQDKNGRDIYEGDILFTYHNKHYPELKGNVVFEDGRFMCWFRFNNGGTIGYPGDSLKICEIIGNIYETEQTAVQPGRC